MFHRVHVSLATVLLLGIGPIAEADVRLPSIFSDGMVVQQHARVPVWGWASPSETVQVRTSWGASASAVADVNGVWRTKIETPGASRTVYTIECVGTNRVIINDVLIGEVWVCSGQSNMEFQLQTATGGVEEARTASHPRLRLFNVPNVAAISPVEDVRATWTICSPKTAPAFSAVGYFFARRIQETLDVPVGLIESDWGGTAAEAWVSAEGLGTVKDFDAHLALVRKATTDPAGFAAEHARAIADWIKAINAMDPGLSGRVPWIDPAFDDSDWATVPVPGKWAGDLETFDGFGWYRTSFDLPDPWPAGDAVLELGPIDDCDMTWLNGKLVGQVMQPSEGNWHTPRRYEVPAALLRAGRNTLAIRVLDGFGPGGLWGNPEQILLRSQRRERLNLAGKWRFKTTLSLDSIPPRPPTRDELEQFGSPASLFNGMIAPIAGYGIRGVIWYQGESNVGRAMQYRRLFPALITDWRAHWRQGDFPFYYVQIAPFAYGNDDGRAAELREAQAMALALPNTGMAVTMDLGNPLDIHPANKRPVGDRLARWALNKTYGKADIEFSGPVYKRMKIERRAIRLEFDHADGLVAANGRDLSHFTIASSDRAFVPAQARIEGQTILVFSPDVPDPVAVRFAWGAADQHNLKNGAGLAASSFRTDDWPTGMVPRQ